MPGLELVDASLRHGQQALLLSRLRRRHAVRAAELLDGCGFAALEVFGGATAEAQLRFLGEDPFERLRALREAAPRTPLMATLAGQMLVGHRHLPDDVVEAFIRLAAQAGIAVFRLVDPLNDARNLAVAVGAARDAGARAEGVVVCTAAPVSDHAAVAAALARLGCDTVCLHDPVGSVGARRAADLVEAVGGAAQLPVAVSFAAITGQAALACAAAARAGAVRADVCVSPLGGGASLPTAEQLIAGLAGTDVAPAAGLEPVLRVTQMLEEVSPLYADLIDPSLFRHDVAALRGLVPLSAMGSGLAELRERGAMARLPDVEAEITRVRRELGDPPLVSPMPEMMTTQAVYNTFEGDRYATITQEVKDYCMGLLGSPPGPIDPEVRSLVAGGEEPIAVRPADLLEPGLPRAREELTRAGVRTDPEAAVLHALFGADLVALLRGDISAERLADEEQPSAAQAPVLAAADGAAGVEPPVAPPSDPTDQVRDLRVEVDGQTYEVRVFGAGPAATAPPGGFPAAAPAPAAAPRVTEGTVTAPMQGLILKVTAKVGDRVEAGAVVAVLEAMKMQNDITASRSGTVVAVHVKAGDIVGPQAPILDIG